MGRSLSAADLLTRIEWAALAAAIVVAYTLAGGGWLLFVLLLLVPDVSMLFYLAGPRTGAVAYNAVHALIAPLALALFAWLWDVHAALLVALIWGFHIAADRMMGYGLKRATGFRDTTMGRIGRDTVSP